MTESDDDNVEFSVPAHYPRARIIAHLVREVDRWIDAPRGSADPLPDDRSEVDEIVDVRSESGERISVGESPPDSDAAEPSDQGDGSPPPLSVREGLDEGPGSDPDLTSEPPVRGDELEAPDHGVQQEMEEGQREHGTIEFALPTHFGGRGTVQHQEAGVTAKAEAGHGAHSEVPEGTQGTVDSTGTEMGPVSE